MKLKSLITDFLTKIGSFGWSTANTLYRLVVIPKKLPIPVVSVGNIAVGGTGKTPFVHYLANELLPHKKVAILSRGYKRKTRGMIVVEADHTADEVGDEPLLLKRKLPEAIVIVDKSRYQAGLRAIELGAEVILLDDGMQHVQLKRDFEICCIGEKSKLTREWKSRLRIADLIVCSMDLLTDKPFVKMERSFENGDEIQGKTVMVFCALGDGVQFLQMVQEAGAFVDAIVSKIDHNPFSLEELEENAREGVELFVCTEKDFVKIERGGDAIVPLSLKLTPARGKEYLDNLIQNILEAKK